MSHAYTPFKKEILAYLASSDIRVLLVMSNSTADTDQDAEFIADFGTRDEMDGANYVRKALTSEAVSQDDPNNRGEFTADPITWTALGAGTRSVIGAVFYRFVTNDSDSPVIAYVNSGGFPYTANGANFVFTPNAEGLLQAT